MSGLLLGYDLGSSAIKAALVEIESGRLVAAATSPDTELAMAAPQPGWAEQDPEVWWQHLVTATAQLGEKLRDTGTALTDVQAVGIAYQMHGLVLTDTAGEVLRPAIIWCDSRAVETGDRAFAELGPEETLRRLLNSPGNFTASKMRWVIENEPRVADAAAHFLLPGDYIAWRLTGEWATTPSGLSEGILWDFSRSARADFLLEHYGIDPELLPPAAPTFSVQGALTAAAAAELGVPVGTPLTYRGGDQPNNALSLGVLDPGTVAATAGTSGVVYGVADRADYDPASRVNTFVHVNHQEGCPRYGVLLCLNGCGILYGWLRRTCNDERDYGVINGTAAQVPVGADGVVMLPFGNGAERMLGNRDPGASVHGLRFNSHDQRHLVRAAQEGVAFSLAYGLEVMRTVGVDAATIRAGAANLFLSPLFREAFAAISGAAIELYDTDGAQGAARGAAIGAGIYDFESAFRTLSRVPTMPLDNGPRSAYVAAYERWRTHLDAALRSAPELSAHRTDAGG